MVITHIQHFNKRIEIKLMEIKSKKEQYIQPKSFPFKEKMAAREKATESDGYYEEFNNNVLVPMTRDDYGQLMRMFGVPFRSVDTSVSGYMVNMHMKQARLVHNLAAGIKITTIS